jgi:small-conductance mechanosensitive channel
MIALLIPPFARSIPALIFVLFSAAVATPLAAQKSDPPVISIGERKLNRIEIQQRESATMKALKLLGEESPEADEAERKQRARLRERLKIYQEADELLGTLSALDRNIETLKTKEEELRESIGRAKSALERLGPPPGDQVTEQARDALGAEVQQLEGRRNEKDAEISRLTQLMQERAERSAQTANLIEAAAKKRTDALLEIEKIEEGEGALKRRAEIEDYAEALLIRQGTLQLREAQKSRIASLLQEQRTVEELERDLTKARLDIARDQFGLLTLALERRASDAAREERERAETLRGQLKTIENEHERALTRVALLTSELKAAQFDVEAELSRQDGRNVSLEQRASNAKNRLERVKRSFPEGGQFEDWKRTALGRKLEQAEGRSRDFAQKTVRERPRLREVRDQAISGRDRLTGLLDLMDEISRNPEQLDEAVAIDEDGTAGRWLRAAREQARGEAEIERIAQRLFANRDWEEANEKLREQSTNFIAKLTALEEAAARGLEQIDSVEASLEATRSHLEGVRFWLREPSLFSGANFDRAIDEASSLPERVTAIPEAASASWRDFLQGPPAGSSLWIRLGVALGLGLLAGFGLRLFFRREARRSPPPPAPSLEDDDDEDGSKKDAGSATAEHEAAIRSAEVRRVFFETLSSAALPICLAAALQGFLYFVRPDHVGLSLVASILTGLVIWRLVASLEKTLLSPGEDGNCQLGCDRETALTLRHTLGRAARAGCLLLPLATLLDALELARWADLARWAFGVQALVVGIWLSFRRDLIDVLIPRATSSVVALAFRSVTVYLLPVVLLGFAAVIILQMMGYRNAGAFYLTRSLMAVGALLAAGLIFQIISVTIRRKFLDDSGADPREAGSEDEKDRLERRRIIVRLATFAAFVAIAGATLAFLSWLLGVSLSTWRELGDYPLIGQGEDEGFNLRVGDILRAGIIFFVGLFAARIVRDGLALVLKRRQMARGSRYVIRTLVFYLMVGMAAMLAVSSLGIRLGQLGWLLGAAGIGIGFGLQEIISNFIAGLILFFERPVQVGDIISVGDVEGDVERISIRATVVRTRDGISIILPNKRLITDDVINWSHGDQRTRLRVQVGVAYGSDVELVTKTLLEVTDKERRVMRFPRPEVQFKCFGESELSFEILLWLASPDITLRRRVRSDLNSAIDAAFRAAGIEIPFPQRDLHIRPGDGVIQMSRETPDED